MQAREPNVTVSVCGGRRCPVLESARLPDGADGAASNGTIHQVVCQMPGCPAAEPQPVMLHVSPVGYAMYGDGDQPLLMAGRLSLVRVLVAGSDGSGGLREPAQTLLTHLPAAAIAQPHPLYGSLPTIS